MLKIKSLLMFLTLASFGSIPTVGNAQTAGKIESLEIRYFGGSSGSRIFRSNHSKYLVTAYFETGTLDYPQDASYVDMVIYAQKGGSDKPRTVRFRPGYINSKVKAIPFQLNTPHDQSGLYINKLDFRPPPSFRCKGGGKEFYKRNPRARLVLQYLTVMQ